MSDKNKTFNFEDHFSKHSEQYAQYRPQYPDEIYAYLASIAQGIPWPGTVARAVVRRLLDWQNTLTKSMRPMPVQNKFLELIHMIK